MELLSLGWQASSASNAIAGPAQTSSEPSRLREFRQQRPARRRVELAESPSPRSPGCAGSQAKSTALATLLAGAELCRRRRHGASQRGISREAGTDIAPAAPPVDEDEDGLEWLLDDDFEDAEEEADEEEELSGEAEEADLEVLNSIGADQSLLNGESPVNGEEIVADRVQAALAKISPLDDPEAVYYKNLMAMTDAFDKGEIHTVLPACYELLESRPDDVEVWRSLTTSLIRLGLHHEAMQACQRWLAFDPYSLPVRNAQAVCLANLQQYGEARARFAALGREVADIDPIMAEDLFDCQRRVEELWLEERPGVAQMSTPAAKVVAGFKLPHSWLPNFAESFGPIKVLGVDDDDDNLNEGPYWKRKVVVTRDVPAGELLFVQRALVFGKLPEKMLMFGQNRLEDALHIIVHMSARAAMMADLIIDQGPLEEDNQIIEVMKDINARRQGGPWPADPAKMGEHQELCKQILDHHILVTGNEMFGVWPLLCMMRHSCAPNASLLHMGDHVAVRAAKDLKAGEEVTYTMQPMISPEEVRQEFNTTRGFWCRCPRCQAESQYPQSVRDAIKRVMDVAAETESRILPLHDAVAVQRDKEFRKDDRELREWLGPTAMNHSEEVGGRQGLAAYLDHINRQMSPEEKEKALREGLVEPGDVPEYPIPKDLLQQLGDTVAEFESALSEANITKEHRGYALADVFDFYADYVRLLRAAHRFEEAAEVLRTMCEGAECAMPGSFHHMEVALLLWDHASRDLNATRLDFQEGDVNPATTELEQLGEVMRLRYGAMTSIEEAGILLRTGGTRLLDENWFWEMEWAVGMTPPESVELVPGCRSRLPVLPEKINDNPAMNRALQRITRLMDAPSGPQFA